MICRICGLEAGAGSVGAPDICAACDCGQFRDGRRWSYREALSAELIRQHAQQLATAPRCDKCGHVLGVHP